MIMNFVDHTCGINLLILFLSEPNDADELPQKVRPTSILFEVELHRLHIWQHMNN